MTEFKNADEALVFLSNYAASYEDIDLEIAQKAKGMVNMRIDMLEKQRDALQKHNNELLNRARAAEMKLKKGFK